MHKFLLICSTLVVCGATMADTSPWFVPGSLEVNELEIEFTARDGAVLSGTLRVPAGVNNGPAVVIPQQTRTHYRNNPLYVQTAEVFNAIGFSAFIYDRRGKGKSGGEMPQTDYHLLAADAVAAKKAIGVLEAVDASMIGFWGISQSGWISMEAAATSDAAFVIVVSSPLTTPGEQMAYYTRNIVLIKGEDEAAADQAEALWNAIMDQYMRGEINYDQARNLLLEAEKEPWFEHTGMVTAETLPEDISGIGWLNEMDYDPRLAYESITAPMLFILGGKDWVIQVQKTIDLLDTLEPAGEREVHVIPSADHGMLIQDESRILSAEEVEAMDERDFNPNSEIYYMIMGEWLGRLR